MPSNLSSTRFPRKSLLTSSFVACLLLFQPQYGYFSSPQLEIFTTATENGYDFSKFKSSFDFENKVAERYGEYLVEEKRKQKEAEDDDVIGKGGQQLWHTPTELFKVGSHSSLFFLMLELTSCLRLCLALVRTSDRFVLGPRLQAQSFPI